LPGESGIEMKQKAHCMGIFGVISSRRDVNVLVTDTGFREKIKSKK